jgi:hypothetical protein
MLQTVVYLPEGSEALLMLGPLGSLSCLELIRILLDLSSSAGKLPWKPCQKRGEG